MKLLNILFLVLILASCGKQASEEATSEPTDEELRAKAEELAKKFIITDGHVDLPYRLKADNFN
ncbi:membrane dipeptidase, partial [Fulvivirga sp. RKSG066]|nr:membrane dipeptidase [Fulvivirga aurantia]